MSRAIALSMTAAMSVSTLALTSARADPVSEFYAGKTVDMIIGSLVGNDFDLRGRLISRHMGKFIPGKPEMRARNMPGGGGVVAVGGGGVVGAGPLKCGLEFSIFIFSTFRLDFCEKSVAAYHL